jgi:hypothetical protein
MLQETPPLLPAVFMMPQGTAAVPRTSQSGSTDWRATTRRTTPTSCCALMQAYMSEPTACTGTHHASGTSHESRVKTTSDGRGARVQSSFIVKL